VLGCENTFPDGVATLPAKGLAPKGLLGWGVWKGLDTKAPPGVGPKGLEEIPEDDPTGLGANGLGVKESDTADNCLIYATLS